MMPRDRRKTDIRWDEYAHKFTVRARAERLTEDEIARCLDYARPIFIENFPIIFDAAHFSHLCGYDARYIFGVTNAPHGYYRQFEIAKRSGRRRLISEPLPSLKEIQRWILENILRKIEIHPAAKAYRAKKSIKDNGRFHRKQSYVFCIDIKDFFPSIGFPQVYSIFRRIGYSKPVCVMLSRICTFGECIPQGSPTSPAISNIVCFWMDKCFFDFARSKGLRYTRYSDDLTFSGNHDIRPYLPTFEKMLSRFSFCLNEAKTRQMTDGQRKQVTGLVVNEKLQVPREIRRDVRQQAYYIKKYGLEAHLQARGGFRKNAYLHLSGLANYVLMINSQDRDAIALKAAIATTVDEADS